MKKFILFGNEVKGKYLIDLIHKKRLDKMKNASKEILKNPKLIKRVGRKCKRFKKYGK